MKMADTEKAEGFVADDTLPECPAQGGSAASVRREPTKTLKNETTSTSSPPGEKDEDSPLQTEGEPSLLSMPCLMKELRRDSPEYLNASTGSDKPASGHAYESDSSNPCMLSPSSSGHLADSDTLSSGEEGCASRASGEARSAYGGADAGSTTGGQTTASSGRKSRRLRSESEMSASTMAAKKNRCQPAAVVPPATTAVAGASAEKQTNGRLAKVKGHRSQKHKERIRLLRQKREAAARKKYNLLQDSSTSDSDLTCDSSTSSSEDEDEATGKSIPTDIPAGFRRAAEGSGVGAQIQGLLDGGGSWDRNGIGGVLEEAMTRFAVMQRQTEERFRVWMEKLTRLDSDHSGDSSVHSSDAPRRRHRHRVPRPSPPSSFLPSSESQETMAAYTLARVNANVSAAPGSRNNNHILPDVVPVTTQNGNLDASDPGLLNA